MSPQRRITLRLWLRFDRNILRLFLVVKVRETRKYSLQEVKETDSKKSEISFKNYFESLEIHAPVKNLSRDRF
jgi:hypothetical protein